MGEDSHTKMIGKLVRNFQKNALQLRYQNLVHWA